MGTSDELATMDGLAQAELVRRRQVQPIELVDAAIGRIERLNPRLNAVVTPMFEQARTAARGPLPDGPFAGVPMLVKDLVATVAGVRMTHGSRLTAGFVPDHDSELVVRMKRAGLLILGKTSTPEFGILPTTEAHLFGPTRNPWNLAHSTGGSSGGSAAAVASGMVAIGHGGDGGGSIRIPASCCGLFGLKPTRGRNPLGPDLGELLGGLVVEHVVTRSVRDSAAMLDATAGPDLGDPYWAPPPARPWLQEVGAPPGRLRIAFTTATATGAPVHPECIRAVHDAAALCRELGHEVVEATPVVDAALLTEAFVTVFSMGTPMLIDGFAQLAGVTPSPEQVEPLTWALYQMARDTSATKYLFALQTLHAVSRQVAAFFVDHDVLLTPTLAEPPVPIGTFDAAPDDPLGGIMRAAMYAAFTPLQNATGQPAMSVPLHWTPDGLPVGAHFVGRFGDEATLLRLAAQLETARPWAGKRP